MVDSGSGYLPLPTSPSPRCIPGFFAHVCPCVGSSTGSYSTLLATSCTHRKSDVGKEPVVRETQRTPGRYGWLATPWQFRSELYYLFPYLQCCRVLTVVGRILGDISLPHHATAILLLRYCSPRQSRYRNNPKVIISPPRLL